MDPKWNEITFNLLVSFTRECLSLIWNKNKIVQASPQITISDVSMDIRHLRNWEKSKV